MTRSIIAIVLATLAFSIWGYIWYATVFDDIWQVLIGKSEAELLNLAIVRGHIQSVFVIVISFVQALAICFALHWKCDIICRNACGSFIIRLRAFSIWLCRDCAGLFHYRSSHKKSPGKLRGLKLDFALAYSAASASRARLRST